MSHQRNGAHDMIQAERAIPIFRSFDEAATKAFYVNFLGFEIEHEHRFDAESPLFLRLRLIFCMKNR